MAAQILAVIIFIVMFGLIIWDHIERHIVSRLLRFWPVCFWQTGTHYAVWTIR